MRPQQRHLRSWTMLLRCRSTRRTHAHTCMRTCAFIHTHYMCIHVYTYTCMHAYMYVHDHHYANTCMLSSHFPHMHTRVCVHMHVPRCTCKCPDRTILSLTHTPTYMDTHAHAYLHTYIHMYTHPCTHTHAFNHADRSVSRSHHQLHRTSSAALTARQETTARRTSRQHSPAAALQYHHLLRTHYHTVGSP